MNKSAAVKGRWVGQRKIIFLIVIAITCLSAVIGYSVIRLYPIWQNSKQLTLEMEEASLRLSQLQAMPEPAKLSDAQLRRLTRLVPTKPMLERLMIDLQNIMTRTQLQLLSYESPLVVGQAPDSTGQEEAVALRAHRINLSLGGTMDQLQAFIAELHALERHLQISDMSIIPNRMLVLELPEDEVAGVTTPDIWHSVNEIRLTVTYYDLSGASEEMVDRMLAANRHVAE